MKKLILSIVVLFIGFSACKKDLPPDNPTHTTTPVAFPKPSNFPAPNLPADNPLTKEGIALGRHLYYEKRMSIDNTVSCASCHVHEYNFSLPLPYGIGVNGPTHNSVMIHSNLAWQETLLWNGFASSIEQVAYLTIIDPVEMNSTWEISLGKIENDPKYISLYEAAYGPNAITTENSIKAIAQFVRTMVSGDSKYDKWQRGEEQFTTLELEGYQMFNDENGDCFHCHGDYTTGGLFGAYGDLQFSNNGLDSVLLPNLGREGATGDSNDRGKFKIPSLRNIEYSFPYMHDGRFTTLQDVIEHYNMGGHITYTIDPNMKKAGVGRNWSQQQKDALLAFLRTLSDNTFIADTSFSDPW